MTGQVLDGRRRRHGDLLMDVGGQTKGASMTGRRRASGALLVAVFAGGSSGWSGNGSRIGAHGRNDPEGVPDGPGEPDDVVVGRAGGGGREGLARGDHRAVPPEAPERDHQDGPPDDERPRPCVQGGGCGEEAPRPPVLLGRHLVARGRMGRIDEAGVGLHPGRRARSTTSTPPRTRTTARCGPRAGTSSRPSRSSIGRTCSRRRVSLRLAPGRSCSRRATS